MKNNLQEQLHRIKEMMSVMSEEPMEYKPLNPKIKFNNGGSASIQASRGHYSEPRNDHGPYTSMEIGFPSEGTEIPDSLLKYEETSQHGKGEGFNPYESIYAYVPVSVVKEFIDANGGISIGRIPPMAEEDDINLSDKIQPYSKFESAEELLYSVRDRLANAVQMQEWSLVEEVTADVFNFVKNKMEI